MVIDIALDDGSICPTKAHDSDAGYDLYIPQTIESGLLRSESSITIDTGVHVAIPHGYVGMIKSRSGLNIKHDITCEGVIDSGYTGSIVVKAINHSRAPYIFEPCERIAQMVILPIPDTELRVVDALSDTERGTSGFGASGRF